MKIAKPIQDVIDSFSRLPGIGPKTAQRLAFYLLHVPQRELDTFAESVKRLKIDTKMCAICKNISDQDPCVYCRDVTRDKTTICVVEQAFDIIPMEKTGKYSGVYHVLHGSINPLENIGPEEIFIDSLIMRIQDGKDTLKEVIIATNPTMEGEATAMYISKEIKEKTHDVTVSRLGMGMPTGAYLEFTDELTLKEAMLSRRNM